MRQTVVLLLFLICNIISVNAQSFLKELQKKDAAKGTTVEVHQDAAIDKLVNGNTPTVAPKTVTQPTTKKEENKEKEEKHSPTKTIAHINKPEVPEQRKTEGTNDIEIPVVDMRKKVMGNSYKITGYRVQAFSGGNTRKDRQRAEQIRNDIKMNYPDEPVYVHFYSPRWICRVGNYRTFEEAHRMLLAIRKLGYKQAFIVKGKITVQY